MNGADAARPECEWHGLWHRHNIGAGLVIRVLAYVGTPVVLAVIFVGDREFLPAFFGQLPSTTLVSVCTGGCFELLYFQMWARLLHRRPGWPLRIAGHLATIAVAVAVSSFIAAHLIEWIWGDPAGPTRSKLHAQVGIVSVVTVAMLVTIDEMAARARRLERRADGARVAALRAELAALQARTDPHFLFNCLNTVAALIVDDPPVAEAMLDRLAAVFRYALDAGMRAHVALAEEVAAVSAYLEVEAMRLGSRLEWRIDCDPGADAGRALIPPLVVQPLVENAILHGAGQRRGTTRLVVSIRRRDRDLVTVVEDQPADPGVQEARVPAQVAGTGTALGDLAARLALAYGDRARVVAGAAPPAGWRVEVVLPAELA